MALSQLEDQSEIEVWRTIEGYEGIYEVSNMGRVRSLDRTISWSGGVIREAKGSVMKTRINDGYEIIDLHKSGSSKTTAVHRLVLSSFLENPLNKPFVNHLNGVRNDNRLENLEWCTPSENNRHAYKTGLFPEGHNEGAKNGRSKLNEEEVRQMRDLYSYGFLISEIAKKYNVTHSNASSVVKRKSWKYLK